MDQRRRVREHSFSSDITTDSEEGNNNVVLSLEPKSVKPFKTQDEYLYAMKEDLAEWFNALYGLDIVVDNFFDTIETGVILCHHANNVNKLIRDNLETGIVVSPRQPRDFVPPDVHYRENVKSGSFQSRDNLSNFILWCRALDINDVVLFETDDLVMRKNPRSVVLCLLEVARRGARYGMLAPCLIQLEQEIEAEIAGEPPPPIPKGPMPQIKTIDMMSLDEMVREIAGRCTCPTQFQITRVSEGKYRIGDSQTLIFVRILRKHVMVRIGGGWDTLEHFLDKHDPCRCNIGHKAQTRTGRGTRRASLPAQQFTVDNKPKPFTPQATPIKEPNPTQTKKRSQSVAPSTMETREIRRMTQVRSSSVVSTDRRSSMQNSQVNQSNRRDSTTTGIPSRCTTPTPVTNTPSGRIPRFARPGSAVSSRSQSRCADRPSTPTIGAKTNLNKRFHSTGNVNEQNNLSVKESKPASSQKTPVVKTQRTRRQSIGDTASHLRQTARSIDFSSRGRESPSPERPKQRSRSVVAPTNSRLAIPSASRQSTPSPEPKPTYKKAGTKSKDGQFSDMHKRYHSSNDLTSDRGISYRDGSSSGSSSTRSSPIRTLPNRPLYGAITPANEQSRGRQSATLRPRSSRSASVGPSEMKQNLSRTMPVRATHDALGSLNISRDESGRHRVGPIIDDNNRTGSITKTNRLQRQNALANTKSSTPKARRAGTVSAPYSSSKNDNTQLQKENKDINLNETLALDTSKFEHIKDVAEEDIRMNDQMEQLFEALRKQAELEKTCRSRMSSTNSNESLNQTKRRQSVDNLLDMHEKPKRRPSVDNILRDNPRPFQSPNVSSTKKKKVPTATLR